MVVHDLDIVGVASVPAETHPPLIVDADAVLSSAVAEESLEAVAGGHPQVLEVMRSVQQHQLPQRGPLYHRTPGFHPLSPEETVRICVCEAQGRHAPDGNGWR